MSAHAGSPQGASGPSVSPQERAREQAELKADEVLSTIGRLRDCRCAVSPIPCAVCKRALSVIATALAAGPREETPQTKDRIRTVVTTWERERRRTGEPAVTLRAVKDLIDALDAALREAPRPTGAQPAEASREARSGAEAAHPATMVREFHEAFGVALGGSWANEDRRRLRRALIREEFREYRDAEDADDPHATLDALVDMAYVIIGAALEYGWDFAGAFAAVHAANMAKLGPDRKPIVREDGKVLKPDGWRAADLTPFLREAPPRSGAIPPAPPARDALREAELSVIAAAKRWAGHGAVKTIHVLTCPECERLKDSTGTWCPKATAIARDQLAAASDLNTALRSLDALREAPRPTGAQPAQPEGNER